MGKTTQPEFGKVLYDKREERGLTQTELATAARVSSRTIFRAENEGKVPGRDIILRLAFALGEDAAAWSQLAGYAPPRDVEIETAKKAFDTQRNVDSTEISGIPFDQMLDEVGEGLSHDTPKLMCVCYCSQPNAVVRTEIREKVAQMIAKGLHLAMYLPYPKLSEEQFVGNGCAWSYRQVLIDVVQLFLEYRAHPVVQGANASTRVRLFYPGDKDVLWVPPVTSFSLRPTYVVPHAGASEAECRLGTLVELPHTNEPRWFDMYSPTNASSSKHTPLLRAWRGYFDAACRTWAGHDDWNTEALDDKSWRLWPTT